MEKESPFIKFCRYIDEAFFSEDSRGNVVRFVVDEAFMKRFCKVSGVSESEVMDNASSYYGNIYIVCNDILEIKGLLAIQTYAACKRASGNGYSSRNFRKQLSMLLNLCIDTELQPWMVEHQEDYWQKLYEWCKKNDYVLPFCYRKKGVGRYTQYPLRQASGVFTVEELKYIAHAFVDKGLHPDDNLTYDELWSEIRWEELDKYLLSKHARLLYITADYKSDAQHQIYEYFNRWDGEYLERKRSSGYISQRTESSRRLLYIDEELQRLILTDENQNCPQQFSLSTMSYRAYKEKSGGRKQLIVFKKDDVYGGWQEVRSIELGEEGRVLIWDDAVDCRFNGMTPLISHPHCKVYRVTSEDSQFHSLYATPRPYRLEGGLKVGKDAYLLGGAPILKLEDLQSFWVDNIHKETEGNYELNHLNVGRHIIRIRGYKPIIIDIVDAAAQRAAVISVPVGGWQISRRGKTWAYKTESEGVRGMDFVSAGVKQGLGNKAETPVIEAWARLHHGLPTAVGSNIAINTLKNICEYGKL